MYTCTNLTELKFVEMNVLMDAWAYNPLITTGTSAYTVTHTYTRRHTTFHTHLHHVHRLHRHISWSKVTACTSLHVSD